ncbi:MAG: NADH-quinone oxidoreductase subunit NuoE [Marinovum sp.]|nr:NADH-quinone oxidoreductase subunit NuoE [Marinovum sp.]
MLRRLYPDQPESFAFTQSNLAWAEAQITKYPEGREASAVIPLLWRAQEQEGWLTRPAIEHVADMLGMPYMRALEVASFYFMFQLQPVGNVAHIQVCGTTTCMICGAEDLIAVCREKIASKPHQLSEDGKFSWEEVECLGACANAPMAQIGKDYYEDLTAGGFAAMLEDMAAGNVPVSGPQNGRYAAEPSGGLTSLKEYEGGKADYNGSVQRAVDVGDTIKRIDGTEVPLNVSFQAGVNHGRDIEPPVLKTQKLQKSANNPAASKPAGPQVAAIEDAGAMPEALDGPRGGQADDLKQIKGIGPKLETLCNSLGFYHFDQIAAWTEQEAAWVDQNLTGFKGRVTRDGWVSQAKTLASGAETEFASRVKSGDVYD